MSADPRQRLVVAHSVDPAAAEHEVQGNLAWRAGWRKSRSWSSAAATNQLHQRGPSTWSRPAPWSAGETAAWA